jgi:hypothetical protein
VGTLLAHIGKEIVAFNDLLHGERRRTGERGWPV